MTTQINFCSTTNCCGVRDSGSLQPLTEQQPRNPVDLVVTDQHLGDGGSINVVVEMKRSRPNVPVILFSGSLDAAVAGTECADLSFTKGQTSPREMIAEIAKLLTKD